MEIGRGGNSENTEILPWGKEWRVHRNPGIRGEFAGPCIGGGEMRTESPCQGSGEKGMGSHRRPQMGQWYERGTWGTHPWNMAEGEMGDLQKVPEIEEDEKIAHKELVRWKGGM